MDEKFEKNSKEKPPKPTTKETIQISRKTNIRPSIPTFKETVLLDKSCILLSNKKSKENESIEKQNSDKIMETRLFINKKIKERIKKNKLDLLEKKKLTEERKKKLDQLQKTTKELAKVSIKHKIVHDQNKCKMSTHLPTESKESKVDQTWSPPPKIKKNSMTLQKKLFKSLESSSKDNGCLSDAKNNLNISPIHSKTQKDPKTISHTKLIEKKPEIRNVTKPENLFSELKLNDQLNYNNINNSILLKQNHNNIIEGICNENEKQQKESVSLIRKKSDVNLNKDPADTLNIINETFTDLKLPNKSHQQIIKSIDHSEKSCFDKCLISKECYSEATQTDDFNNLLSRFSSKSSSPPMNFMSVLKCKNNICQSKLNNLQFSKPVFNSCPNEYPTSNNYYSKKIITMNNVESTMLNTLDLENCDEIVILSKNHYVDNGTCSNESKYLLNNLIDKTTKSESNCISLNETTTDNCKQKNNIISNDKLSIETNINNEDIKYVSKIINCDLDFLTKERCETNNLHNTYDCLKFKESNSINKSPSCFPEIFNEFQAELDTLDQLSDSLCDIEKMSCNMSIKTNEQSIDEKIDDYNISNDLNLKRNFGTSYFNNNKSQIPFSKLNMLSTSMSSVDKIITGFSIQMFEQLIKDEEIRAKQHHTILQLKEKSLINRIKWEVTMSNLQLKNLKNILGYDEKQFKQKQRGVVKKLEYSLYQIKRLDKVIDLVYKQRLKMFEEHIQHLKKQSSKKTIRTLKNLHQFSKKEEHAYQSLSADFLKQYEKTNFVDNEDISMSSIELNVTSSPTIELDKCKINLQNRATSPINNLTQGNNVEIQTNVESLQSTISKSKQRFSFGTCENKKSIASMDFTNKYELDGINIKNDEKLSSMLSVCSTISNHCTSETSTSSENSDIDVRITTLQEQLKARKLESFKLRKEEKNLRLENLRTKEIDLLKQIELCNNKIEESKKRLKDELEKKKKLFTQSSIKHFSKPIQKIINFENDLSLKNNNQYLNVSNKIMWTDKEKNVASLNKPEYELQQKVVDENQSFESSEFNQVYDIPLHKVSTTIKVNTLKKPNDTKIHISNNYENNCTISTSLGQINDGHVINLEVPSIIYPIKNHELSNTHKTQENNLEKTTCADKSLIVYSNMSDSHSNSSFFVSSNQRKYFVELHESCNNLYKKKLNGLFEVLPNQNDDNDYSLDFTSNENTLKCQKSHKFNKYDNTIEQTNDESSSYEEERSEGDVLFEDKTFIEKYLDDSDLVKNNKCEDDEVDTITNKIFDNILNDAKQTLISNSSQLLFPAEKDHFNNLTKDTSLLMILKREEEHQNMIFLSEQATIIADVILKRHLHSLLSDSLQMYLPQLNEIEMEKLTQYLNWSSTRKKIKLSEYLNFQDNTNDVCHDETFEMFYQKYQEQKKYYNVQDESNDNILKLNHTQQEADKLKLEQMRIEKEIERLRMSEESRLFLREIPNKPPPPYKSPTKKNALFYLPYTSNEIHKIVVIAASQLFNDFQCSTLKDYALDSNLSLHSDYKTLIFDYCKELLQDTTISKNNIPIWKMSSTKLKNFQTSPKNPKELSNLVLKKLNQIIDIDECEEKVNKFVVKQIHGEDSKWTDFQMDEMDILNEIVQNLMNKLVCDTVTNLNTIFYLKFT